MARSTRTSGRPLHQTRQGTYRCQTRQAYKGPWLRCELHRHRLSLWRRPSFWVDDVKTGGLPLLRDQLGGCTETAQAASGMEAVASAFHPGSQDLRRSQNFLSAISLANRRRAEYTAMRS